MKWRLYQRVSLGLLAAGLGWVASARPQGSEGQPGIEAKQAMKEAATAGDASTKSAVSVYPAAEPPRSAASQLLRDFIGDQKSLWTSPKDLRFDDALWLAPLSGIAAGLFVTDASFSRHLSKDPKTLSHYRTVSDASVGALIGGAGGMWALSHFNHNEHWRETGFLAGEAALNSLLVTESMKYSLRRERPYQDNANGSFFQSGGTSFPSEHAAAAWSVAGIVAHEYPGPLTKIMAYGLASLVDYSRIRARQHFPSDVFVGSLIGNLVAQNIYSRHHDPELGGGEWKFIGQILRGDQSFSPANHGSPYVPLDSWIYPAFDRLIALGLINSGFVDMRPWTRSECARLLGEVDDAAISNSEAEEIFRLLEAEFQGDSERSSRGSPSHGEIESLYSRVTGISGAPLTDGNHFGQTLIDDYGRPYQEGLNSVDGISAWATSGHGVGYVRAEYQHAPFAAAQSAAVRQFIYSIDGIPGVPPAQPYAEVNRIQLLDAYAGLNFENWQVTFGRQSLWWGPSQGGPFLFSDNAEPINMFRVSRVSPFKLPGFLSRMGVFKVEWFLGQFVGHDFIFRDDLGLVGQFGRPLGRQPFVEGEKISFKLTPDLEFSAAATTVFGGGPTPLTWRTFLKTYHLGSYDVLSGAVDYTDGRTTADFSYRIPGLRKWLTLYGEAFSEDEISPLPYLGKSAFQLGIYMPRIPGVPKLDLRLEGGTTAPVHFVGCHGCFYTNDVFPGGSYLNSGNIVGSWFGRGAQGEQAWSTYWLSARNKIQFRFRQQKVDANYLPHGGTLTDGGVSADFWLGKQVMVSGAVQYERWNYPLLAPRPQSNVATSMGLSFYPRRWNLQLQ